MSYAWDVMHGQIAALREENAILTEALIKIADLASSYSANDVDLPIIAEVIEAAFRDADEARAKEKEPWRV